MAPSPTRAGGDAMPSGGVEGDAPAAAPTGSNTVSERPEVRPPSTSDGGGAAPDTSGTGASVPGWSLGGWSLGGWSLRGRSLGVSCSFEGEATAGGATRRSLPQYRHLMASSWIISAQ